MRIFKSLLGLVTLALALFLLAVLVLHPFVGKEPGFRWSLLGAIPFIALFVHFGRHWLFNYHDMNLVGLEPGDPLLKKAQEMARARLPLLADALAANRQECFIKLGLETNDGSLEHIWCTAHSLAGNVVVASLANQPRNLKEKYLNRRFEVTIDEIEDFSIMTGENAMTGGYSMMAIAQSLLDRGHRLMPAQKKLLLQHSAYREWFPEQR